jgi:hypothetical protein
MLAHARLVDNASSMPVVNVHADTADMQSLHTVRLPIIPQIETLVPSDRTNLISSSNHYNIETIPPLET